MGLVRLWATAALRSVLLADTSVGFGIDVTIVIRTHITFATFDVLATGATTAYWKFGGNPMPTEKGRNMMSVVRDGDLRSALSAVVARQYRARRHLLVPEVDILVTYPGRIDALLVADRICGFEIKSDVDSLRRLPRQVEIYGPVLERATLVVGKRHAAAAAGIVPPWWAIWGIRHCDGDVVLTTQRRGRLNPDVDPFAVATFIPRDVVVHRLRAQGIPGLSRRSVAELRYMLAETNSKTAVLKLARSAMLARLDWKYRATQAYFGQHERDYVVPGGGGSGRSASCVTTVVR